MAVPNFRLYLSSLKGEFCIKVKEKDEFQCWNILNFFNTNACSLWLEISYLKKNVKVDIR